MHLIKKIAVLIIFLSSFFGGGSQASNSNSTYDLTFNLLLNGKKVTSPKIILKKNETSYFYQENAQNKTQIDILATDVDVAAKRKGILLKFQLTLSANQGEKVILIHPEVAVKMNQMTAVIEQKINDQDNVTIEGLVLKKSQPETVK